MIAEGLFSKLVLSLGITIFLLTSFFGVTHMGMSTDGMMGDCPFSVGTSLCTMTPLQHLGAAESFLRSLPSQNFMISFLLSIIFAVVCVALFSLKLFSPPKIAFAYDKSYRRGGPLPNFLEQSFSRGILNSKTF